MCDSSRGEAANDSVAGAQSTVRRLELEERPSSRGEISVPAWVSVARSLQVMSNAYFMHNHLHLRKCEPLVICGRSRGTIRLQCLINVSSIIILCVVEIWVYNFNSIAYLYFCLDATLTVSRQPVIEAKL